MRVSSNELFSILKNSDTELIHSWRGASAASRVKRVSPIYHRPVFFYALAWFTTGRLLFARRFIVLSRVTKPRDINKLHKLEPRHV